ncbi:hypothetical protein DM01DRAFT_1330790 [Hesseltinella vesiculosa]|uniref:Uncharacterized protein n=1 Tax=Hesseltinella vesiculosa TaxID=101127 RepID=A0A1X2GX46_9FUNG|nr:hypothetical protein DM01DRAFT_1330790 [Hesseltinella vesiculosa]
MTHLSDFSYLERTFVYVYLGAYLIYSLAKYDRFESLRPSKIFSGELKSILTILLLLMTLIQATADVTVTYIKYTEGFTAPFGPAGPVMATPYVMWRYDLQMLSDGINYVQCVAFSIETSLFFLVQCFWNYLSNSIVKRGFMSSSEFRFYVVWALCSMALFPVLQWVYRNDELKREVIPQMAYSVETMITSIVGIRNNRRFRRLINSVQKKNAPAVILAKLSYFKIMNNFICLILFLYGSSFFILCVDGLTTKTIAANKFASDVVISNANICVVFYYLLFIMTFHPRRQFNTNTNNDASSFKPSSTGEDVEMNQSRFSQRVNNFIDQRQPNPEPRMNDPVYMRPMTPEELVEEEVHAYSPPPQPSSPPPLRQHPREIAIHDPYSAQPVTFSVINPHGKSSPANVPHFDQGYQ